MKFKEIARSGVFCWSPNRHRGGIAIGTTRQQFDAHFGSDCKLETFNIDIQNCSQQTILEASNTLSNSLNCISWHQDALICGTQLKTLQAFSVGDKDLNLIHETEVQTSNYTCLDFNLGSNSLASGNEEGAIDLWDIDGSGSLNKTLSLHTVSITNDPINLVKWNKQVHSILASASNANIHVWDTRKPENTGPIMRVHDNNATSLWGSGPQSLMVCSSLSWSNTQATSLIIANSNDANPFLQVWDLRYATCPIKNMRGGHSRGIVSISWNDFDEELLLSAGKDNAVCLWNPLLASNELLAILPYTSNQWINDIKWCKWEPSLFAISSFDGNTSIYNITQTNSMLQTNTKILESFSLNPAFAQNASIQSQHQLNVQQQPILSKAPKWLKVPCGATWGFGGKLITYNAIATQTQPPSQFTQHVLSMLQVRFNPELVERAEKLENAIINENLMEYCLYKISENSNNKEMLEAWKMVSSLLENDLQKQKEITLGLLGFPSSGTNDNIEAINNDLSKLSTSEIEPSSNVLRSDNILSPPALSPSGDAAFFSNINATPEFQENFAIGTSDNCLGSRINKGILTGSTKGVIDNCIANNYWAEAILLCCFVSPENTASTIQSYFNYCLTTNQKALSPLLWCVSAAQTVSEDAVLPIFQQLIAKMDLKYWREALVFIIKESDNWEGIDTKKYLIDKLAGRLVSKYNVEKDKHWLCAAAYCFILNGDYNNVSKISMGSYLDQIELSLILQKATSSLMAANDLTAQYASLLAAEGKFELAVKYIENSCDVDLRNRIIANLVNPQTKRQSFSQKQPVAQPVPKQVVQPRSRTASYSQNSYTNEPAAAYSGHYPYGGLPNVMQPSYQRMPVPEPVMPPPMAPPPMAPPPIAPPLMTPQGVANLYAGTDQASIYSQQHIDQRQQVPIQQVSIQQVPIQQTHIQQVPIQPVTPGWNDPPVFNAPKPSITNEQVPLAPISNPLPGYEPQHQEVMRPLPAATPQRVNQPALVPPANKPPEILSPQNQHIYNSFEMLVTKLQQNSSSQALSTRRKLDDAKTKIEALKCKLASHSQLSQTTLQGLSEIANAINHNDFHSALGYHSNLVAATTFGETATFLPAIKVLLHLAHQQIPT